MDAIGYSLRFVSRAFSSIPVHETLQPVDQLAAFSGRVRFDHQAQDGLGAGEPQQGPVVVFEEDLRPISVG